MIVPVLLTRSAPLVLLLVVLSDLAVLGTTRLTTCIRAVAAQGLFLSLLPLLVVRSPSIHAVSLAFGTALVKAVLLPGLLVWAMREAAVRREVEPSIGPVASLLLGTSAVALAFAITARLPVQPGSEALLVPYSIGTLIIGFIVLTTRRKAVTQVVGYLMLENGIYLFGLTQAQSLPFLLDLGVLLDVFVGVFIMGIVVFHINREFDTLDSDRLTGLVD